MTLRLEEFAQKIIDLQPVTKPRKWDAFADAEYEAYIEGQHYIMWILADELRKILANQSRPETRKDTRP